MLKTTRSRAVLAGSAAVLAIAAAAPAQETEDVPEREVIVVTGSLTPRPASELGSAISVLDADQLVERQTIIISDALRAVPGVAVSRSGPQGTLTQVRIRGAEANQTLVFIDGVEAANPAAGEFNFANLVAADIERVEVVRGAQSALYGSEAIGGVISVITRTPEAGFEANGEAEAGSFGTYRLYAGLGGGSERFRARGGVNWYGTDGISAAPNGAEDDGFWNIAGNFHGIAELSDNLTLDGVLRYVDSTVQFDAGNFAATSIDDVLLDADVRTESTDLTAGIAANAIALDGLVRGRAYANWTDGSADTYTDGALSYFSEGERADFGVQATLDAEGADSALAVTLAAEHEAVEFANQLHSEDDEQTSFVLEANYSLHERFFLSGSVRHDINDTFADATTYRAALAYEMPAWGARLHASYGEGITDPTFTERFGFNPGTFVGNPNLNPEESQGFDIGWEQTLLDGRAIVDVTYFSTNLTDEITTIFDASFVSTPINQTGTSDREGVEVTLTAALTDALTLDAQYTYLDASDPDGAEEVRRAPHIASANLVYRFLDDRALFNLGVDYNGEQQDNAYLNFSSSRVTLDAYTLVRVAGSYEITDRLEVFARGENVLDEDYQDVFGYATPGAAAYVGIRGRY